MTNSNNRSEFLANLELNKGANSCIFQASINNNIRITKSVQPANTGTFNNPKTWALV